MDYTLFFEKHDQLSFKILQNFTKKQSTVITQASLRQEFGLADYRLNQILIALNRDLATVSSSEKSAIAFLDKKTLIGKNITTTVLYEIRLKYLQRSRLFAVFNATFLAPKNVSKKLIMNQFGLNKAQFYAIQVQLRQILEDATFSQNPTVIKDPEHVLRLHLFDFYYNAFNGLATPFKDMAANVKRLVVFLQEQLALTTTPVQRTKIEIFLQIWLLRQANSHFIAGNLISGNRFTVDQLNRLRYFGTQVNETFSINVSDTELQYLYVFLVSQADFQDVTTLFDRDTLSLPRRLTDELLNQIKNTGQLINTDHVNLEALEKALLVIHCRLVLFYVEPTTFNEAEQMAFFSQTYPVFNATIQAFIEKLQARYGFKMSCEDSAHLYFEYMFALINHIPTDALMDKVYVCVDFSQGELYSEYIVQTLKSFQNANIKIERNITGQTDIYLSDFYSTAVKPLQTIWRNPPTAEDWAILGDNIITIKGQKLNQLLHK